MSDPGHASGNQTYPNPAPDCGCGHAEVMHELNRGRRGRCGAGGPEGRCPCMGYYEKGGEP